MRIDWQAYLDGSLESAQKEIAEQLLRDDPVARHELNGLKSFTSAIQSVGLSETVPIERLEATLSKVVVPVSSRPNWHIAVAASVALLAVIFAVYRIIPRSSEEVIEQNLPPEFRRAFAKIEDAQVWANASSGINAKMPSLASSAKFQSVHGAKNRVCYDFWIDNHEIHIRIIPLTKEPSNCYKIHVAGGLIYAQSTGMNASFMRDGMVYTVYGTTKGESIRLAEAAIYELEYGVPGA